MSGWNVDLPASRSPLAKLITGIDTLVQVTLSYEWPDEKRHSGVEGQVSEDGTTRRRFARVHVDTWRAVDSAPSWNHWYRQVRDISKCTDTSMAASVEKTREFRPGPLKPPLPDPLKTPPFFSQWAKLENFFANASGTGKTPRARRPRK